ncbi:MAG: hypothetical protein HZB13_14385 [Acidobacteria bacterium]|nr:hypothetical protein [Acidobacteriota bacterium]
MVRSILAVLAGWGTVGVLVVCTDLVMTKIFPDQYVAGKMPPDSLAALSLATSTLWSVVGGWVTARLAASKPWRHILGLFLWGELMGVVSAVMTWGLMQHWYQIGLLLAWLPAVVAGGWIRVGKAPARADWM